MQGEQIPRATMNNFIKKKMKFKVSHEFTDALLSLSKQFIFKITDKANQLCEAEGKKTINSVHLYKALEGLSINHQIEQLQQAETALKQENQIKSEIKQQKEERSQQIRKMNSETEEKNYNNVVINSIEIKESFEKLSQKDDEDEDYDNVEGDEKVEE